ncbi:MAG: phosphoglycerate mutase family protein, partial [Anaerolineales bacterium]|nr:phosphoglycerate mutase family protein [Anaerolineales bacterium]
MSQKNNPSSPYIFTFLRHGESTGNAENRHQGQADFPLTKHGENQVKKLADYWKRKEMDFDLAISSPLTRAKQSAEILDQALNLKLEYDQIWMERDNGELAGLLHDKAKKDNLLSENNPLY